MCILCNMKYEDLCALVKDSISGLVIQNCEKIEEITLPRLDNLRVKNCPNLYAIHCQVDQKIILQGLPVFTTLDISLVETKTPAGFSFHPFVQEVSAFDCPEFLMSDKYRFSKLIYYGGCDLAIETYRRSDPTTTDVVIEKNYDKFLVTTYGLEKHQYTLQNL
jgi:hypothetical protein